MPAVSEGVAAHIERKLLYGKRNKMCPASYVREASTVLWNKTRCYPLESLQIQPRWTSMCWSASSGTVASCEPFSDSSHKSSDAAAPFRDVAAVEGAVATAGDGDGDGFEAVVVLISIVPSAPVRNSAPPEDAEAAIDTDQARLSGTY